MELPSPEQALRRDDLLAAARAESGLTEFGDESFLEPLDHLLAAIVAEAGLSPMGAMATRMAMVRALGNRLRMHADLTAFPEILREPIFKPLVIVGLPRTGTSKLQRMLSADPNVQRLYFWRLLNPAPLPGWKRGEPDARLEQARQYEAMLATRPDFLAAHPMAADAVDEDVFLMELSFEGILPLVQYHVPSFRTWLQSRSRVDFYAFEKRLLQYLQWQEGGDRSRPWILKAQTHLGGLEALVENFPDVTLVHCHRDLPTALTSTMRTGEGFRGLLADDIDLVELGRDLQAVYKAEVDAYLEQRARLEHRITIVDVAYRDILEDPMKPIAQIYAAHGRTLTPEAVAGMAAWSEDNPQYRFGKLSYSPESYGFTAETIAAPFTAYAERFAAYL